MAKQGDAAINGSEPLLGVLWTNPEIDVLWKEIGNQKKIGLLYLHPDNIQLLSISMATQESWPLFLHFLNLTIF